MLSATNLKLHQKGVIASIDNLETELQLLNYGFFSGSVIELVHVSKLKNTYCFLINNSIFALRKKNAEEIKIHEKLKT